MSILLGAQGCMAASAIDYGLVLPASPLNLETIGTTARYIILSFNNNFTTNRTGTQSSTNWNPKGFSRSLFEVRLRRISGSNPNSGDSLGDWKSAASNYSWRWDLNDIGTKSSSVVLEIRNATTHEILASCTINLSLEMEASYTTISVTVGVRSHTECFPVPKGQQCHTTTSRGFLLGSYGSRTPTSFKGHTIRSITYTFTDGFWSEYSASIVVDGNAPNLFRSIQFQGGSVTLNPVGAYNPVSNTTRFTAAANSSAWATAPQGSVRTVTVS